MPVVQGAPKALNDLLEGVYQSAIKEGKDKEAASKIAWAAAKKSGWKKTEGGWKKFYAENVVYTFSDTLSELCLNEPELDKAGNIVTEKYDNSFLGDVSLLGATLPENCRLQMLGKDSIKYEQGTHLNAIRVMNDEFKIPDTLEGIEQLTSDNITIPKLPIFDELQVRGMHFDMEGLVSNFKRGLSKWIPSLTVGHDREAQTKSGYPRLGNIVDVWVENVKDKSGNFIKTLFGKVENVPKVIAKLIENGAYNRISPEIFPYFPLNKELEVFQFDSLQTVIINGKEETNMPDPNEKLMEDLNLAKKEIENLKGEKSKMVFDKVFDVSNQLIAQVAEKDKKIMEFDAKLKEFETKFISVDAKNKELEKINQEQVEKYAKMVKVEQANSIMGYIDEKLKPSDTKVGISDEHRKELYTQLMRFEGLTDLVQITEEQKKVIPFKAIIDLVDIVANKPHATFGTGELDLQQFSQQKHQKITDINAVYNQAIDHVRQKTGKSLTFSQMVDVYPMLFDAQMKPIDTYQKTINNIATIPDDKVRQHVFVREV